MGNHMPRTELLGTSLFTFHAGFCKSLLVSLCVLSDDAECSLVSGETAMTELSSAGDRASWPATSVLHKIQQSLLELMHRCWHSNPDHRPKPLELLKAADSGGFFHVQVALKLCNPP